MSPHAQVAYEAVAKGLADLELRLLLDLTERQAQIRVARASDVLVSSGRKATLEQATGALVMAMRNCPEPGLRSLARLVRL